MKESGKTKCWQVSVLSNQLHLVLSSNPGPFIPLWPDNTLTNPFMWFTADFSGSTSPGTVWLLTNQSTVEFISDDFNNLPGFNATYSTANTSNLSSNTSPPCQLPTKSILFYLLLTISTCFCVQMRRSSLAPLSRACVSGGRTWCTMPETGSESMAPHYPHWADRVQTTRWGTALVGLLWR